MSRKLKKEVEENKKTISLLVAEVNALRELINKMWEETHPPTMGGK